MYMKRIKTVLLFLIISYSTYGQELNGKWQWNNENLSADVFFGNDTYFIQVYIKGTQIKISEAFMYYKIHNDSLIFGNLPFNENPDQLSYYSILHFDDNHLELLDLSKKETDNYTRQDHENYSPRKLNINQFYYQGGGIACVSDSVYSDYNNCLNFTSFGILSTKEQIESYLGTEYSRVEQNGITYSIYLIPCQDEPSPYLAISLTKDNQLQSIQITGNHTSDQFAFSGIRLGDYYTMVEQRLGKPSDIQIIDEQTELWSYKPFTISIEIKNNTVFSIKLRRI